MAGQDVSWFTVDARGVSMQLIISANAAKNEIIGVHDGRLKIKICKPAINGKANQELVRFLARTFSCAKSDIQVVHGEQIKQKTILITGLSKEHLQSGLGFFLF